MADSARSMVAIVVVNPRPPAPTVRCENALMVKRAALPGLWAIVVDGVRRLIANLLWNSAQKIDINLQSCCLQGITVSM